VKAYVVVSLGWSLIGLALNLGEADALKIAVGLVGIPINLAICFFLLRGSEALWWIVLALLILALASASIPPGLAWYYVLLNAVLLVLLVAPETRRHCGIGRQPSL
jgi:hypothetical protein